MYDGSSGSDASLKMPSFQKVQASVMSRTNSSPGISESSIDKPMRLAEIYVAAENALHNTVSNPDLWKSLSSTEEFEVQAQMKHALAYFWFTVHAGSSND